MITIPTIYLLVLIKPCLSSYILAYSVRESCIIIGGVRVQIYLQNIIFVPNRQFNIVKRLSTNTDKQEGL